MVELYWPRSTTFLAGGDRYAGPGVHDVPDDLEEQFRARGWEDPPQTSDGEDEINERALELADEHWQRTIAAVEDGEVDGYLDDLEEVDERPTVLEAIDDRRDELEG